MRDEKNPNRIYGFGDEEVALLENFKHMDNGKWHASKKKD